MIQKLAQMKLFFQWLKNKENAKKNQKMFSKD